MGGREKEKAQKKERKKHLYAHRLYRCDDGLSCASCALRPPVRCSVEFCFLALVEKMWRFGRRDWKRCFGTLVSGASD